METNNPDVRLVEPNIERDAPLGVKWLEGDLGRSTLMLMGVADKDNKPSNLEAEKERVKDFIEKDNQLNWMIEYKGQVVGSVWADLEPTEYLLSPSVHIMIGDPNMRGKGVGITSIEAVVEYLENQGNEKIYSRHLLINTASKAMLHKLDFKDLEKPYTDKDGLEWQNVVKEGK